MFCLNLGFLIWYCTIMKTTADLIPLLQKKSAQIPQYIAKKLLDHGLHGLSASHAEILYYLLREGPLKMRDLSKRINKDKSTVTALINKLLKLGYVTRQGCSEDSRVVWIHLSQKGQQLAPIFQEISAGLMAEFFKPFSKKELYDMHDLLTKIEVSS